MISRLFCKKKIAVYKKLENPDGRPRIELDNDLILKMKKEGMSNTSIAKKLGVSNTTIKNRLYEMGFHGIKSIGKPRLDIFNSQIYEMKEKGMTNVSIAKKLGCSEGTIRYRLKEIEKVNNNYK